MLKSTPIALLLLLLFNVSFSQNTLKVESFEP
ncbi:MAG: hypothetical protein ACI97X_002086, partial [Oceanospirillaceae bacterium]